MYVCVCVRRFVVEDRKKGRFSLASTWAGFASFLAILIIFLNQSTFKRFMKMFSDIIVTAENFGNSSLTFHICLNKRADAMEPQQILTTKNTVMSKRPLTTLNHRGIEFLLLALHCMMNQLMFTKGVEAW